jgi:hypothetical protein
MDTSVERGEAVLAADGRQGRRSPAMTSELAAFVLVKPTPHARILGGGERPLEAFVQDRAPVADGLGAGGLGRDERGWAHGEEELRILADATGAVDPRRLIRVVSESSFNHLTPSDPGDEVDLRPAGHEPGERNV